jgi:hypothetical protein
MPSHERLFDLITKFSRSSKKKNFTNVTQRNLFSNLISERAYKKQQLLIKEIKNVFIILLLLLPFYI